MALIAVNTDMISQYKSITINTLLAITGIILMVLIIKYSGVSARSLIQTLQGVSSWHLIVLILAVWGQIASTSLKWETVLRELTDRKNFVRGYFMYYSAFGIIANTIYPHIGQFGLKVTSMRLLYNVPIITGTLSVFIEQLFDFIVLIFLIISSLLFFSNILSMEEAVIFNVIVIMLMSALLYFYHTKSMEKIITGYNFLYKAFSKIPIIGSKLKKPNGVSNDIILISKNTTMRLFYYSYFRYLSNVLRIYIVAVMLKINLTYFAFFLAAPVVFIVILLGSVPASLGTFEAGWFGVLRQLDVNMSDIGTFVIVNRIFSLSAIILIFLGAYCYYILNSVVFKTAPNAERNNNGP